MTGASIGRHRVHPFSPCGGREVSERLVIFFHVPKCGGVTMSALFDRIFGNGHYGRVNFPHEWLAVKKSGFARRTGEDLAVSGHASWGIHSIFAHPKNVFYVTTLREPFRLFLSDYRYARMNYTPAKSPEEYLENHYGCNMMTAYLGDGDLDLAKRRLAETYFLFGLVERYRESVALLAHHLGLRVSCFSVRNKSRPSGEEPETDSRLQKRFAEKNLLDIELYQYALNLFEERLKSVDGLAEPLTAPPLEKLDENSWHKSSSKAREQIDKGRHDEAAKVLEAGGAKTMAVYRAIARAYQSQGDEAQAERWLREGVEKYPSMIRELYYFYEQRGNLEQATRLADAAAAELLQLDVAEPPDASFNRFKRDILFDLARYRLMAGERDAALTCYRQAYRAAPTSWDSYLGKRRLEKGPSVMDTLSRKERVLVLRLGPLLCLDSFFDTLAGLRSRPKIELVIQEDLADHVAGSDLVAAVHRIAPGRFDLERERPRLSERLWRTRYDAVIVVINRENLSRFQQAYALAAELNMEVCLVYPMINVCLGAQERFFCEISVANIRLASEAQA